jgi:urea transport system permease protein
MTTALRVLLAAVCVSAILASGQARAVDTALVQQLGTGEVSDKVRAIEALTRLADPAGLPILRALRDGNMAVTPSGQVIVLEDGIAKDAATLQPLEPAPEEYETVTVNNRVRGQLEAAFSAFQLFSDSRDERLAAAKELESSAQASVGPILEKVLATETDPAIKSVLAQIKAGIDLKSSDPEVRLKGVSAGREQRAARPSSCCICSSRRMPTTPTPARRQVREAAQAGKAIDRRLAVATPGSCSPASAWAASCCWPRSGWPSPTG